MFFFYNHKALLKFIVDKKNWRIRRLHEMRREKKCTFVETSVRETNVLIGMSGGWGCVTALPSYFPPCQGTPLPPSQRNHSARGLCTVSFRHMRLPGCVCVGGVLCLACALTAHVLRRGNLPCERPHPETYPARYTGACITAVPGG